jgi:creatinine amidohydrolase
LILPVGAVEQHGPHLPLTVDIDIAEALATELAQRLGGYLAAGIVYSARSLPQSGGGPSFPGTIAVRGTTLIEYFTDVLAAYIRCGARSLVVVNGHYENEPCVF